MTWLKTNLHSSEQLKEKREFQRPQSMIILSQFIIIGLLFFFARKIFVSIFCSRCISNNWIWYIWLFNLFYSGISFLIANKYLTWVNILMFIGHIYIGYLPSLVYFLWRNYLVFRNQRYTCYDSRPNTSIIFTENNITY